jgi:Sec-independent protein secretion pathway component TatC
VVSMILMAIPLMILYEIGIFGATWLTRKKAAAPSAEDKPA